MNKWRWAAAVVFCFVGIGCGSNDVKKTATAIPSAQLSIATTRRGLSLMVLTPEGKPAAEAMAVLVPPEHCARVTEGKEFDDDPTYIHGTADAFGQLNFAQAPKLFLLVIIHKTGSAQFNQDAVRGKAQIKLAAWGTIKGRRFIGDKAGAGHKVAAWATPGESDVAEYDPHAPSSLFVSKATADSHGNFELNCIPPGEANLNPDDPTSWGKQSLERPLHVVNIMPGETVTMDIGGKGRAVVGHVTLPSELLNRRDWAYWFCTASIKNDSPPSPMPKELEEQPITKQIAWWGAFNQSPEAAKRVAAEHKQWARSWAGTYPVDIGADGRFRVEDVEAGTYNLCFNVLTKKTGSAPRTKLAEGKAEFTVSPMPGGRSDRALELPPVPVKMAKGLQIGEVAPDFTAMGLNDKPLFLSQFHGKFVLLEFWATWCGPCVNETDNVKAVYDKFGSDPRFVMLSLSMDKSPDKPAHFAAVHGLSWHQGFIGDENEGWDSPVVKIYADDGIPSIWLIGPDGKVIDNDLGGHRLQTAVAKALSK